MAENQNLETLLSLTESAAAQIKELMARESGAGSKALRLTVTEGGCSGKEYTMAFDDERPDDVLSSQHGVNVVVDPASARYLAGTRIDYLDSLNGGGFKVSIPRATQTCGCGKSFQT
jgi:iron-sulfur cluster assembly accessory protein